MTDAYLDGVMPYLTADCDKVVQQATAQAVQLINNKELTPEVAIQLWYQVWGARRTLAQFQARLRANAVANKALEARLQNPKEDKHGA